MGEVSKFGDDKVGEMGGQKLGYFIRKDVESRKW